MLRRAVLANTVLAFAILGVLLLTPVMAFATTPSLSTTWPGLNWAIGLEAAADGSVWVANTSSNTVRHYDGSGALLGQLGGFNSPEGVAVGPDGSVFVADSGNHRVVRFSAAGTQLGTWGVRGDQNSEFWYPEDVAVSSDGIVYVTDTYNARIQYFTTNGTYLGQWGTSGTDPGQFQAPSSIAVGQDGSVYVADPYGSTLQRFSSTGTLISRFATYGLAEGQVQDPEGIAVGPDGNVYVTDTNINVFSASGAFLYRWITSGSTRGVGVGTDGSIYAVGPLGSSVEVYRIAPPAAPPAPPLVAGPAPVFAGKFGHFGYVMPGEFYCPMGLAIGPNGNVWVADFDNARVQGFTPTGVSVDVWDAAGAMYSPQDVAVGPTGRVYAYDTYTNKVYWYTPGGGPSGSFGSVGSGPGQFNNEPYVAAMGIAVDSAGTVYVSDPKNGRIEYFNADGVYQGEWATAQPGDTKTSACEGLAIALDGSIYASDAGKLQIVHFSNRGAFLGAFGGYGKTGTGLGEFNVVLDLAVGPDGSVFVADTNNHRIEQFTSDGTFVTVWGSSGTADGQFFSPYGVAVAADGTIYVADFNGRIEYFTPAVVPYPTTTVSVSPSSPNGTAGWYKTAPAVTLTTDRAASKFTQWDSTSGSWSAYSSAVTAIEGSHTIYCYASDAGGSEPAHGTALRVDTQGPGATTVSGSAVGVASARLTWTAVTDSTSGLLEYAVYDADTAQLLATTNSRAWTLRNLVAGSTHRYYVAAVDNAGNQTAGNTVTVTTLGAAVAPTTTLMANPAAGTGLVGWYVTGAPNITLSSDRLGATYYQWDSSAPAGFHPYVSAITAGRGDHTLYYFSADSANTSETVKSRAFKVDTVAPGTPVLTGWAADGTTAGLSWPAITDVDSGIARYDVIDVDAATVAWTGPGTSTSIGGLAASSTHRYQVKAYDNAGNVSGASNIVSVTMPDAGPFVGLGSNQSIVAGVLRLTFPTVTSAGSVHATTPGTRINPPPGYRLVGNAYYDVTVGARFSGNALVGIPYVPTDVQTTADQVKMFHYTGGAWVECTSSRDTAAHVISGSTVSFSPFGLYEPDPNYTPPVTSTPASSDWSMALLVLAAAGFAATKLRRSRTAG